MRAIDSDAHVIETMETWADLAEKEPALIPMITRRVTGQEKRNIEGLAQEEFWVINGRVHNRDHDVGANTTVISREMHDITAQLKRMDELEIDVQVLFPTPLLRPVADKSSSRSCAV